MIFQDILNAATWRQNANGVGQNMGPLYREPGLMSIGGKIPLPGNNYMGGTIGMDQGRPFMNQNINGQETPNILYGLIASLLQRR